MTAYSPLGSPDRPSVNKDEPIVLSNPLLKKIADKHKTTIALVSCLYIFYSTAHSPLFISGMFTS